MPVSLTLRIPKGSPLTAVEHDQNLTNLKNATDANTLSVTGRVTQAEFDLAFEGEDVDGKKKVDWANVTNVPVGVILPTATLLDFAGSTAPSGYLLCDGSAVSRTTYADLFAVLGAVYGPGDGVNTFNVPDFRGRTSVGRGSGDAADATAWSLGQKRGAETHKLVAGELAKHSHELFGFNNSDDGDVYSLLSTLGQAIGGRGTNANGTYVLKNVSDTQYLKDAGNDVAHNNIQPSLTVTKIIKT